MIGLSTPVSDEGSTTCSGSGSRPGRSPGQRVVPVDPEQVAGVGGHPVDAGERRGDARRHGAGSSQLGEGRQAYALLAEPLHGPGQHALVDHVPARPSVLARYVEAGSTPSVLASESVAATGPVWQAGSQASS